MDRTSKSETDSLLVNSNKEAGEDIGDDNPDEHT